MLLPRERLGTVVGGRYRIDRMIGSGGMGAVFVDGAGRSVPKLLDFGITKLVDTDDSFATATGVLVGTPYCMSPEQIRAAKAIDGQSDVWSAAVVLFEVLSGAMPFDAPIPLAVLSQVLEADPAPLAELAPGVPAPVVAAVHGGLTKAPERRPDGMAALMDSLLEAARASGVEVKDPRAAG